MRSVIFTIESNEGPAMTLSKKWTDGGYAVTITRRGSDTSPWFTNNKEAVEAMAEAAAAFIRDAG